MRGEVGEHCQASRNAHDCHSRGGSRAGSVQEIQNDEGEAKKDWPSIEIYDGTGGLCLPEPGMIRTFDCTPCVRLQMTCTMTCAPRKICIRDKFLLSSWEKMSELRQYN